MVLTNSYLCPKHYLNLLSALDYGFGIETLTEARVLVGLAPRREIDPTGSCFTRMGSDVRSFGYQCYKALEDEGTRVEGDST
jgi:hypothetical protein